MEFKNSQFLSTFNRISLHSHVHFKQKHPFGGRFLGYFFYHLLHFDSSYYSSSQGDTQNTTGSVASSWKIGLGFKRFTISPLLLAKPHPKDEEMIFSGACRRNHGNLWAVFSSIFKIELPEEWTMGGFAIYQFLAPSKKKEGVKKCPPMLPVLLHPLFFVCNLPPLCKLWNRGPL